MAGLSAPSASGGVLTPAATQFTRPANTTAYASGQLVANNTVAGSVVPLTFAAVRGPNGSCTLRRAKIKKSGTSVTNAAFRLHLYKASPTVANGDGGVWSTNQAANYIGSLDVVIDKAFTDGAVGNGVPSVGTDINLSLTQQTVYGLLEARGAYTPASGETFDVSLELFPY